MQTSAVYLLYGLKILAGVLFDRIAQNSYL